MAGAGECGDEPSGSIKCGEFIAAEDLLVSQEGLCSMEFRSVLVLVLGEIQRTRSSITTPAQCSCSVVSWELEIRSYCGTSGV